MKFKPGDRFRDRDNSDINMYWTIVDIDNGMYRYTKGESPGQYPVEIYILDNYDNYIHIADPNELLKEIL